MRRITLVLLVLLSSGAVSIAENSDDPLLDARIQVVDLQGRYTEKHPKVVEAEAYCAAIAKYFSESPEEYRAHVQERIVQAEADEAELSLRYKPNHPKYILVERKLTFLRKELQRS